MPDISQATPDKNDSFWFRNRFVALLITLIWLLLTAPLLDRAEPYIGTLLSNGIYSLFFSITLLSTIHAASRDRVVTWIIGLLVALAIIVRWLEVGMDNEGLLAIQHASTTLAMLIAIVVIFRVLFEKQRVTINIISASLCVYLLSAVMWGSLFSLVEFANPGSYHYTLASDPQMTHQLFVSGRTGLPLYFSLVTMSTLGYGDVIPVTAAARMFAAMEAVLGQLYIAVLVARLVGLHTAQPDGNNDS